VLERGTLGSVRGALGNERPYRVRWRIQPSLKTELSSRLGRLQLGTTNVAPHRRQASVAGMAHDFLVRNTISISRRNEASP